MRRKHLLINYAASARWLKRGMELFSFRSDAKREYEREMRRKRDHVEREFNPDRPNVIWVSDVTSDCVFNAIFPIFAETDPSVQFQEWLSAPINSGSSVMF